MRATTGGTLHYTEHYRERLRLGDGTAVELRCVRPDDGPLLRAAFARLSPESRTSRFHMAKDSLSDEELRYFTQVDGVNHLALGALQLEGPEAGQGLAVARFIRDLKRPQVAEAAFTVIDAMQGKGLGRLLLPRLAQAARERGIERFECTVLRENLAMRHLLASLGAVSRRDSAGTLLLEVPLGTAPGAPAGRQACAPA